MKVSDLIVDLERRNATLAAVVEVQAAALEAQGRPRAKTTSPVFRKLSRGHERALLGVLWRHHPNSVHASVLMEHLPPTDRANHLSREPFLVRTLVSSVRRKLGRDVIENLWHGNYRLSDAMRDEISASPGAPG